jgi:uncharacterized protein (DUF1810 family)
VGRNDLQRFVDAQDEGGTFDRALAEIKAGRKATHWMWFVFPQLAGLGRSPTSARYAITSLEEARAYLAHEVLGARLRTIAAVVAGLDGTPESVFGALDAQKLRSSMTLFLRADPAETVFSEVLEKMFGGTVDPVTDDLLGGR